VQSANNCVKCVAFVSDFHTVW